MSKIAFISDIHGNYPALNSVLEDCRKRGVNSLYCLGDLVGYYSQINEVIDELKGMGAQCLMGNHDFALVHDNGVISRSKTCTNVLSRQLTYITSDNFSFLKESRDSMVVEDGEYKIFCVHGGLKDHIDEYIESLDNDYFSDLPGDITHVVTAHNHKACNIEFNKISYANSGSVGQPRDHDPRSSYVIFEDGRFEVVRVEYDIDETVSQMRNNGFPDYIAEILYRGCRIGE